ncbi:MAG: hypothetical protein H7Z76_13010 [Methylotenera sp.]|nr:hypothetical protein [Flavobacterium sp.]
MKTIKPILFFLLFFFTISCVNQKQKDQEEIKQTVKNYFNAVKANDLEKCKLLIEDSENYLGVIQGEFNFLHKNYDEINPNDVLLRNILVKDTLITFTNEKEKYVQYIIKNDKNPNNLKKPLIITFMFYKPVGYDKIFNRVILENHIGWDK